MSPLFGGNDDQMKKVGEDMQKLSEQIAALQQQLRAKTTEADSLRSQVAQNASASTALQDAQKQMQTLRDQLKDMQAKQSQSTGSSAELEAARAQIQALQGQLTALQQSHSSKAGAGSASTASTASVASAPAAGGLAIGSSAWVTRAGGLPLRLRSGPDLSAKILDRLQPGTKMTLKEGPQQADGHAWWHIRTDDGREGWVAGEDLRSQPD
ncbi:MAG TPA: SH3 domain-containing protein [Roseiflexaceae bacterium]|nr:SH3 domain-containing protein [Roseiflexaceae bacterium]